ncbi:MULTISPECIES: peptidylprolyl isomerase [Halobacterium]|uniref:peptidylprolyl isomerase n=4 Tax=Halobacterium salinarum TaxID=2242 RepID=F2Z6G9_HALSA|nr:MULTISPECIES: peptidylprolyl isomerase [Halobacterium]AAG19641.1 peptidyl-prolyl cis-trans isomerase [Halobacterium salinarum NRC-1]MBB6090331.1 FKBP-type peptidyl-prolyl cis-trans isomerase SlyD [Halobacterium salinarum]MCF2165149.1 peptidylprolyl isomerase [Halobacterium salinarum]MCF2168042.1 peptidylprolyl isomerase [Halobacterium salinarum]MCF2206158.1 peptidylprolyl isomerase [Halobacterium salinarum]
MSDEPEAEQADSSSDEQDGFQTGDFVELSYTAYTVDSEELVDTTDEEIAESEGVDTDEQEFSPRTIVLGEEHIFAAVEDDIVGQSVGDDGTVLVEEAFGEYDEDEVRTVSANKIPEDDRYPGAHVDVDGEHGHVEAIIGGRARVDFNHPLAGEDIEYEYEVLDEITDREQQAVGFLEMMFDVELDVDLVTETVEEEVTEETEDGDAETTTESVEKETLYIEQSPQLQFNQQWMMGKSQVLSQVIDMLDIDRVIVQEIIDGQPAGMPGMGGMMGGAGGDLGDVEDALEDADVDADEIVDELDDE